MVDVGGGMGYELLALHHRFAGLPGRLVLQELPETIDNIVGDTIGIEIMAYNFFDPQPVRGARVYYFHQVFHDWPDSDCRTILRNTASAMKRGHSILLIQENILPDVGVPSLLALIDIHMMTLFAAMERTEKQWRALLSSVGFEVVNLWPLGPSAGYLIEAVLNNAPGATAGAEECVEKEP